MSVYQGIALPQCDIRYLPDHNVFMLISKDGRVIDEWPVETASALVKFMSGGLEAVKRKQKKTQPDN